MVRLMMRTMILGPILLDGDEDDEDVEGKEDNDEENPRW